MLSVFLVKIAVAGNAELFTQRLLCAAAVCVCLCNHQTQQKVHTTETEREREREREREIKRERDRGGKHTQGTEFMFELFLRTILCV